MLQEAPEDGANAQSKGEIEAATASVSNAAAPVSNNSTAAETATAVNAAQTLAAAINSGDHDEAITDPRLNASPSSSLFPSLFHQMCSVHVHPA